MTRRCFVYLFCLAFLFITMQDSWAQTKRALLIGINTYQPPHTSLKHSPGCTYGRCDLTSFDNLFGTLNDVAAFRDVLTSPKFGFPSDKIVTITDPALSDQSRRAINLGPAQTTHDGILAAMQKYLVDEPHSGDTVVFYYSGHGSLRVNSKGTKLTLVVNGNITHADSTIVPSDAWAGAFDVRDREMARIFNAALDKGIKLTVIFDSCYSGGITRGVKLNGRSPRERWVPYDPRDINEGPDLLANGDPRPTPAERSDNSALVLSAVQQDQTAKESPPPDDIPQHGVFTIALIKALETLPVNTPASAVYRSVIDDMEGSGIADENPFLDASPTRRAQPLFGGVQENTGKVRSAALATDLVGNIVLDTGKLAGIGIGSEFTSVVANAGGHKVTVRVTELDGIARSKAMVVTPEGAAVVQGDVFELTKWVPLESELLHFWAWPTNLSEAEIQTAEDAIKASGITYISDPVEEPWTDMLSWDGTKWILQHAGGNSSVPIGSKLTAETLKENVPSGAKVWINIPPSQELAAKLELHNPKSAVQGVADVSKADYILAGSLSANGSAWAWMHKSEFLKGPPGEIATDHTPGCSVSSRYPVRSNWVVVADSSLIPDKAATLNNYASRLAKLNAWVNLASSPTGDSNKNYYNLEFVRPSDQKILTDGQVVKQDDRLKMMLTASAKVTEKRWVYVLDIDCQGQGTLLYPIQLAGNQFPNNANDERQIDLSGAKTIRVGPPYGLDTIIFISTPQPLPDPTALNFEGVRGIGGRETPLQRLLSNMSSGTRGLGSEIPTDWGISFGSLRSVPKAIP
jgi:hypothetical protein